MKLSKFDIGAEVISILTKGMYQNPRDALREYVQNGIDAGAEQISIKIRQNSAAIIDSGSGMDYKTLRKAIRVGVSDKDPKKKVGFMGIGIYSSFHLCDKLTIYTHMLEKSPLKLEMDFLAMRETLKNQRELRLEDKLNPDEFIDLQSLLEKCISLTDENELTNDDFPHIGTRVEMTGLEGNFLNLLSDYDVLADYLREVVPLHFNKNEFQWAQKIENYISQICIEHHSKFQLVDLSLQVNAKSGNLFRPYKNTDFTNNHPNNPIFKEVSKDGTFFGVVWGCLNSERRKIPTKELRGFLIKKQGFAIGTRDKVAQYFKQRTHFDRYIGEVILTNPLILPNASRSDLEYSQYTTMFFNVLAKEIAPFYNLQSTIFQEQNIANQQISEIKDYLNGLNLQYKRDEKDPKVLVRYIVELNNQISIIGEKGRNSSLTEEQRNSFSELLATAEEFITQIENSINNLATAKATKSNKPKTSPKTSVQIALAKKISNIKSTDYNEANYDSLLELLSDLDIEVSEEMKLILGVIDEKFIQGFSNNMKEYQEMMLELRDAILKNVE